MLKALAVTFIIFAILFSGIIALKRSASHWKVPKGVKPQPYDNDRQENDDKKNEDDSSNDYQKETPQLTDQSKTSNNEQNTETKHKE